MEDGEENESGEELLSNMLEIIKEAAEAFGPKTPGWLEKEVSTLTESTITFYNITPARAHEIIARIEVLIAESEVERENTTKDLKEIKRKIDEAEANEKDLKNLRERLIICSDKSREVIERAQSQ